MASTEEARAVNRMRMQEVLKDPARKEPCVCCTVPRLPVWRTNAGAPVCSGCYHKHFAPQAVCSWCGETRVPVVKRPPVCGICYWRARRQGQKKKEKFSCE